MDIALLAGLIILNGVFAMSELALVTARKGRLRRMAESGDKSAAAALTLGDEPTRFLSTIQIGITAIGLLSGIVGEAALSVPLARTMEQWGFSARTASIVSTAVVVAGITIFSIVVGELVPKRIAQMNAEAIARRMARPIGWLSILARPFVLLLTAMTDGLLRLIGHRHDDTSPLTEEDIQSILADGSQAGVIEKHEHDMVRNVFRLDDRNIASLMTTKSEIVYLDVEEPLDNIIHTLIDSNHSRFPVCRGGPENIIGVISSRQLLKKYINHEELPIEQIMQAPVFVPESLTGMKLLEHFRESGGAMVFVVDEYGEVLGLITPQNLLEALAGEFKPKDPEDVWAMQREDGSWLLDGLIPIPELKDRLSLNTVPEEHKGSFNTLGGMMMWLIGGLPRTGDTAEWEGWRLEVVDLDGNRVDKVWAAKVPATLTRRIPLEC